MCDPPLSFSMASLLFPTRCCSGPVFFLIAARCFSSKLVRLFLGWSSGTCARGKERFPSKPSWPRFHPAPGNTTPLACPCLFLSYPSRPSALGIPFPTPFRVGTGRDQPVVLWVSSIVPSASVLRVLRSCEAKETVRKGRRKGWKVGTCSDVADRGRSRAVGLVGRRRVPDLSWTK